MQVTCAHVAMLKISINVLFQHLPFAVCYAECHLSSSVSTISAAFSLMPLSEKMVKRFVHYLLTLLQTTYDCSEPAFVLAAVFHGDAKKNLLLLRVINSLMS